MRCLLCALVRREYEYRLDFADGLYKYFIRGTEDSQLQKPLLLRDQAWDLNDISQWDTPRVILFFRRIGLKCYVPNVLKFNITGKVLLDIEEDDFQFVNIYNAVHIRKILVEMSRVYPMRNKVKSSTTVTANQIRKEALERTNYYTTMIQRIQRNYRLYLHRKEQKLQYDLMVLREKALLSSRRVEESGTWWLEKRSSLPTIRKMKYTPVKELRRLEMKERLPPGAWGHRDTDVWVPLDAPNTSINQELNAKLERSGYNKRREDLLMTQQQLVKLTR